MPLDPSRTVAELRELRELTGDENGAQRVAWTDTWVRGKEWLAGKLADLPPERASAPAPRRRRPIAGIRPFSVRLASHEPPALVIAEAMRTIAPHLLRSGYEMERPGESQLVFTRDRRPLWTILVAIFVFPFGLFALTHKRRESQVFVNAISVGERRTLVDVVGVAPAGVRRALLELER